MSFYREYTSYTYAYIYQGLILPKNDGGYHFWVRKVLRQVSTFFSLPVLSKTGENKNFN